MSSNMTALSIDNCAEPVTPPANAKTRVTYPRTFRGPDWSVARDVDIKLNFVSVRIENVHAPGKATLRLVQGRGPRLIEQTSWQAELLQ